MLLRSVVHAALLLLAQPPAAETLDSMVQNYVRFRQRLQGHVSHSQDQVPYETP